MDFGFAADTRDALRADPDAELLLSELFSIDQLKRHAVTLAAQCRIDSRRGPDRLLPRLKDNERVLLRAYDVVTAAAMPGQRIGAAEAWLLDNFYLIEQQIDLARRHLPRGYSRQLPRLGDGVLAGFPRIYRLALDLISHQDGRLDTENATHFIQAFQTVEPLRLGELWAFPIMLRLALLENLRRVALRIAERRQEHNSATIWADRMLSVAEQGPKQLVHLLAEFASADVRLSAPFVEELYARVQARGPALAFVAAWIEHQLTEQGVTATQLMQVAAHAAAANQISVANSIGSLRLISAMDWREFVEASSVVEQTLRDDPSATHVRQDFATRDRYRHHIEDLAKGTSCTELDVARRAIALARDAAERNRSDARTAHVGYWLIDRGRPVLERALECRLPLKSRLARIVRPIRLSLYAGSIIGLSALVTAGVLVLASGLGIDAWRYAFFAIAGAIGASALAVSLVNRVITLFVPPRALPRMDFARGVPLEHRTMVVVPSLFGTPQDVADLVEGLEIRYLGNRDPNLFFALLTDFRDAPERTQPDDDALLALARRGIERLNETYREDRDCVFYLFHRPRVWNPFERVWMGYERKRGKLEQFNALLRNGVHTAFTDIVGDRSILGSIRYVITLDTDTRLPRDAARLLIGNIAHPLNRPIYDADRERIVDGYAILQPRASISLSSAGQSRFTRLFAGEAGIDPYTREVSDVYQDVFGEGTFVGKGIYDVDAFRQAVDGRFPENLILSHDLLESGYARSGLVTDVDLIEDHPTSYAMDVSRRHRWIRGDWQIAGWLLPRVPGPPQSKRQRNPLCALSVWKILDNLRRSLVPSALLAFLVGGWLFGPGPAWYWTLLVAGLLFLPGLLDAAIELVRKPAERRWRVHLGLASVSAARPVAIALLTLTLLPYEALISLDAIVRSGVRMPFTRRGLLLWHTRSYDRRNRRRTLADFYLEMWFAPALAVGLAVILGLASTEARLDTWPAELLFCAPVLLLWLVSPAIAWWISTPLRPPTPNFTAEQQVFLRTLARRTWRFFAEFVGPEDNWLPPDNFQEYPAPVIASRTSPTNMGMALLANQAACDFGYTSVGDFLERTERTLASMELLPRYRGHFYNWYDTRTLQTLHPQYVSTVDSGNLIGSLVTLQAGLGELKEKPVVSSRVFEALEDTLLVLAEYFSSSTPQELRRQVGSLQRTLESLKDRPLSLAMVKVFLDEMDLAGVELLAALPAGDENELHWWAKEFDRQSRTLRDDLALLLPDAERFSAIPTLRELAGARCDTTAPTGYAHAVKRLGTIDDLIARCRELGEMDFEFLYDPARSLLTIGFDVDERRRDPACYDLLASEARLASFLIIAQDQVPQTHWFALGRLLTSHRGDLSLISWSGSMFEYLMPHLLMPNYENTLLERTCRSVVSRQIEYGRQRGVPWGISESCYNATDTHKVYQYRAFGVPGLGFKRGLGDDLVIAPYASALALTVMPREACRNLRVLADSGFLGDYGLFEAIDYTPSRVPQGMNHAIVRSFMAHHQGMTLLALTHVLLDRPMQRRFMCDPLVRATQLLLQERVPSKGATVHPHAFEQSTAARPPAPEAGAIMRVFTEPNTPAPEVHVLSNGNYHVMATNAGGGYSRWRDLSVTRWREDATCDDWGTFVYLRDLDTGDYWSSAYQPTLRSAERYEAIFVQARAEYRRRDHGIEAHTEISVSPEDDVEIRRVTLTNLSAETRRIEVTTYAEVVLAPLNADLAHRAFSNLFVQTEILPDRQAILCSRRRRTPEEQTPWMFHLMAASGAVADAPSYETDRARFIGRGRTPANPAALGGGDGLSMSSLTNTDGPVLDPIVAIRRTITLSPDEPVTVQIGFGVAATREAALSLLDKYRDRHFVERAFEMATFRSQEVLRHLNASESEAQMYGRLATSIIHGDVRRRAAPRIIARNRLGQSGLWRFAISGDLPIVLVRIGDQRHLDVVKQALQAHAYWRMKGLPSDLVILNEDFSGYRAELQDQIMGLIYSGTGAPFVDKPGGIFVRRAEELTEEDRVLFQTVARTVLVGAPETLAEQVQRRAPAERLPERLEPVRQPAVDEVEPLSARELIFWNGLGGFTRDGHEYVITLEPGEHTPAPWVNVIASPYIGTIVSESGSAYTWVENAHEFRLTTFHNDPLSDRSGEALYVRDEETGAFWSPTPSPARGRSGYVCRHGFGYTVFEHDEAGIFSELTTYVAMDAPVKFVVVKMRNHSGRRRRLSLTGYWELVLGEWRHANLMHVVTELDPHSGALFARNAYGREWADRIVFAQVSEPTRTATGNRTEFIGRNRSLASPAAMRRTRLSGKVGAGLDPCAALQTQIELADRQEREIVFVIGAAADHDEARHFIQRFAGPAAALHALESVWGYWNHTLGAVHVETPDRALNVLANGWLVYQTLSSRLWGRSGNYQSGGAYGFRDQLQDTMALVHATPWLAREHLIRCAGRQFLQGDVQHWWHPPSGRGVRTHFSDDYLWLPYAVCRYVRATGDTGVLDEQVHFLEGRELNPEEESYYDQPQRSTEAATLYGHCVRSLEHGLRFGAHQLPLIGSGDWNDGMNLVGRGGKGESVWLGWFLYENLSLFANLARARNDDEFARDCEQHAEQLRKNVEANAWDGAWYRRAYFDDGTPLGSSLNEECQIDSISQSWAVISGGGDAIRARQAMAAVDERLVRRDARLIQLLTPPFDTSALEPGYIKGYVPGVRENGGQYTHAAIWATMAFAMMGDRTRAWELCSMLNPVHHGSDPERIEVYKVEPYVMSADIYAAPPHTGRGGWTWYTGAAGWMYRLIVETLLGVHLDVDKLRLRPCIPDDWESYKIHYRYRETFYHITVKRTGKEPTRVIRMTADGAVTDGAALPQAISLVDDHRDHHVEIELG